VGIAPSYLCSCRGAHGWIIGAEHSSDSIVVDVLMAVFSVGHAVLIQVAASYLPATVLQGGLQTEEDSPIIRVRPHCRPTNKAAVASRMGFNGNVGHDVRQITPVVAASQV
jgi:hypothetical protein